MLKKNTKYINELKDQMNIIVIINSWKEKIKVTVALIKNLNEIFSG